MIPVKEWGGLGLATCEKSEGASKKQDVGDLSRQIRLWNCSACIF